MYKLAVFDIDGTLAVKGNEIPETTLIAIKKMKENGIECLIATGRERENIGEILNTIGIENYVACNGHYVKYKEEIIYRYTYPENVLEEIRKICENKEYCYGFSNGEGLYLSDIEKMREEQAHHMLDSIKLLKDLEGEVENIILFATDGGRHFKPLEKNYQLIPWGNGMFDLLKIGRSKAVGIEEIAKRIGVEREKIISFGDGLNDLEMTKYAGLGVAMGNAKVELKKIADYITDTASNDGIYKACKKFGLI
ncbi:MULTISPECIES: Cof-type HAD-IIB family hydrolase [Psychrilyobacter]|uniref:Cof-type HAD-IIB family hydrolase n=1 Tax=Psychrilyobacter piezotolerans TaxID=2293438 RepID=A0ABX9KJX6_9FUSO|nr:MULTISPECIES: Cof-type HAD-IIB family hydrolase [Psychrilyobacter]MCS5421745.1 Cof-type HAD-IIB family hydrolase [Psychrilyobacter sp. S5]NDI77050.1 Cof-type HAD-IIB family hydrolase [Psychrilyobacter piezotolerans]RDE64667.1 Cof-type HAD-IIB family hydrolase [Psychrilyobacter sp. S5]REI42479.1 Cof-type HAD-IIB family hydrolase [Psychrilyobacter piezotolerans]